MTISLIALFACVSFAFAQTQPDQIIEFFREGARGPSNSWDTTWSYDEWNVLTGPGARQQFILGKVMAKKYSNIFAKYDPDNIYILANYLYLSIQSAAAHAQGLFHGAGLTFRSDYPVSEAIPPFYNYNIQSLVNQLSSSASIPDLIYPGIFNVDGGSGIFSRMYGSSRCPNGATWAAANMKDTNYTKALAIFGPTITAANSNIPTSSRFTSGASVISFVDALLVNKADDRKLPYSITDANFANLTYAYTWFVYHQEYAQLAQRQVSAYYPINEILTQLGYFQKGKSYAYKAALYSGHSYSMMSLLAAFNVINEDCIMANFNAMVAKKTIPYPTCTFPTFGSNIVVELYNKTSTATSTVKVLYNNRILKLYNNQESCTYDQFVTLAINAIGGLDSTTFSKKCGAS